MSIRASFHRVKLGLPKGGSHFANRIAIKAQTEYSADRLANFFFFLFLRSAVSVLEIALKSPGWVGWARVLTCKKIWAQTFLNSVESRVPYALPRGFSDILRTVEVLVLFLAQSGQVRTYILYRWFFEKLSHTTYVYTPVSDFFFLVYDIQCIAEYPRFVNK